MDKKEFLHTLELLVADLGVTIGSDSFDVIKFNTMIDELLKPYYGHRFTVGNREYVLKFAKLTYDEGLHVGLCTADHSIVNAEKLLVR